MPLWRDSLRSSIKLKQNTMTTESQSPIGQAILSYLESLTVANYKPPTIKAYRLILAKLGAVMTAESVDISALTPDVAEQLGRRIPRRRGPTVCPDRLARRFATHLIQIGIVKPAPLTVAQQRRAALQENYECYLIGQRGLSSRTIYHTLRIANRFLDHRFGDGLIDFASLCTADVIAFIESVLTTAPRDKTISTHLRTFLQFLFGRSATTTNLTLSVPRSAKRWAARLPRHLSPDGVEAVLLSVQRNLAHGALDYAMLLLMARLGLRAMEVVAIPLDDIDWRIGKLKVRGKGQLHDPLPISP